MLFLLGRMVKGLRHIVMVVSGIDRVNTYYYEGLGFFCELGWLGVDTYYPWWTRMVRG